MLEIGLNNDLSDWVIDKINQVRVWPKGLLGVIKKARVLLKIIIKSDIFNSGMMLCVFLNTIFMGMNRYNMEDSL